MASKPALWPPETTSFGKAAAATSANGRFASHIARAWRSVGVAVTASVESTAVAYAEPARISSI